MSKEEQEETRVWRERLKRHIPILKWLPVYKKKDLVADMIAGLTLGLTLIPQSIAYAALAGLSPEYGLYSSFMGSFIYVIFGTIKEVSLGPTSLMSLLTFEFVGHLPLDFVFLFTFMSGCFTFLLGLSQFGFLVSFISAPVTTSFQSATSLVIISSQLKNFLGLPKYKSGRFLENVMSAVLRISECRVGDATLSFFCCVFLLSLRKLKDVKIEKGEELTSKVRHLRSALWFISISRNALCVIISCVVAFLFYQNEKFPFVLSGNIPAGLPSFQVPPFSGKIGNETLTFPEMIFAISPGVFILPVIAIMANITIAKAFSVGTPIDATQEMLTLGLCNMAGAFVGSMPTCGAFTRSAVSNSSGVRTPLAGLFTGTLIVLVIKFLTPYFYFIPKATLASILICAVIFMIDWQTLLHLRKANKKDFVCAVATFLTCLISGIQVGLLTGVAISVGQLLYAGARPSILTELKTTEEGSYYIVTPATGLFFPANDFLLNEVTSRCTQRIPVVIDCLHIHGIDYTTAQGFKELRRDCKGKDQKLLFVNMTAKVYKSLKNSKIDLNFVPSQGTEDELHRLIFHSEDADLIATVASPNLVSSKEINDPISNSAKPLI